MLLLWFEKPFPKRAVIITYLSLNKTFLSSEIVNNQLAKRNTKTGFFKLYPIPLNILRNRNHPKSGANDDARPNSPLIVIDHSKTYLLPWLQRLF